jgi:hypothetical protein
MTPLLIGPLLKLGEGLINRFFPNPADAAAAQLELLKMAQTGELAQLAADTDIAKAQLEINKEEAKSSSLFISGGRPFIVWVCGAAFAWNWIGLPIARFVAAYAGHPLDIAPADMSEMMPVLLGLLGLGSLRTFEKIKRVAS